MLYADTMNQLDPIAETIWTGRSYAHEMNVDHFERFKNPATVMAKAQTMRSVVQAEVMNGNTPGFSLVDEYLGFGRVEVVRTDTGQHFLLKARSAMRFQITMQQILFGSDDEVGSRPLELLLYEFGPFGLSFATIAADQRQIDRKRKIVLLAARPHEEGIWPDLDLRDIAPFDQGTADDFGDLSDDVDIAEESDT